MFAWSDLFAALALFLVLEGIVPFLNPGRMKRALQQLLQVPDSQLRIAGLGSIVVGLVLLSFIRA
ncbi:MAG: DUF2065 domain-containing protein [Steroidobacteraceae bacterium]|nr:DUF2065 domain-containing protein [Nevskiaceae bacterium]MCP5339846.1 DUF2065 domain-containing protein [Nevskiaceae bacterium]MCP5359778.1 DUF2065 domain-containing protein [Nevskiaceae bacterium]MCP5467425.1 DUF2065 domain-containing protein [Nevskiaceae bacterium]MCP5472732.1 DUF2065 domain-containing protein [Nevskiaceae bacterium]